VIASNEAMSVASNQIQESNREQILSTDSIKRHVNQVREAAKLREGIKRFKI
jgi:hypothetical protein